MLDFLLTMVAAVGVASGLAYLLVTVPYDKIIDDDDDA